MVVLAQDKRTLINFENFHEVFLDEENLKIIGRVFGNDKNLTVVLGVYDDLETAKKEFEDFEDSLLDDEVVIHEFD